MKKACGSVVCGPRDVGMGVRVRACSGFEPFFFPVWASVKTLDVIALIRHSLPIFFTQSDL